MSCVYNIQADALALMGLDVKESKGSMWMQAFRICNTNWTGFTWDQERAKPLVATRFYANKWAKELPPRLMGMLIQEVGKILSFSHNLFFVYLLSTIDVLSLCVCLFAGRRHGH